MGENRWSELVCPVRTVAGQYDMKGHHHRTTTFSTFFTGAGAGTGIGDVCLSRSRARTISFNSETSGDTPEVEALVLT
ncbi:hypothetical protein Tco_0558031 [Tanacetum coccineum]